MPRRTHRDKRVTWEAWRSRDRGKTTKRRPQRAGRPTARAKGGISMFSRRKGQRPTRPAMRHAVAVEPTLWRMPSCPFRRAEARRQRLDRTAFASTARLDNPSHVRLALPALSVRVRASHGANGLASSRREEQMAAGGERGTRRAPSERRRWGTGGGDARVAARRPAHARAAAERRARSFGAPRPLERDVKMECVGGQGGGRRSAAAAPAGRATKGLKKRGRKEREKRDEGETRAA